MKHLHDIADREEPAVGARLPEADTSLYSAAGLRMLWERRHFLWRCAWIGCLCAAVLSFIVSSRYTSTVQLMPPEDRSSSTALAMLSAVGGGSGVSAALPFASALLGMRSSGSLFVGILHSRVLEDRIVDRFDLRRVYGKKRWIDAREKLEDRTEISEDRKTGIIVIKVTDKDPQRAAAMGRAYVEELNYLVNTLSTSSAHRERVFLEERLKLVKQDLDRASRQLGDFSSKNTTVDIRDQGRAMIEAAATLQGQLIAAESELKGLQQIYSDDNIRVRSVRARIDELQHQLERFTGGSNLAANSAARPSATPAPGASATAKDDNLYPTIRQLPLLGVTYADLYREAKIQEVIYETLTKQYELAKVEEAKETPTVQALDPANVPEKRSFPPRILMAVTGLLLAFGGGVLTIWVQHSWSRTPADDPARLLLHDIGTSIARSVRSGRLKMSELRRRRIRRSAPGVDPSGKSPDGNGAA